MASFDKRGAKYTRVFGSSASYDPQVTLWVVGDVSLEFNEDAGNPSFLTFDGTDTWSVEHSGLFNVNIDLVYSSMTNAQTVTLRLRASPTGTKEPVM